MNILELMDPKELSSAIEEGLIGVGIHPNKELRIYTYTQKAARDWMWNRATLSCRGLITDSKGEIVARGFEKFFNVGESHFPELQPENFPLEEPEVLEKLDGWIGTAYEDDGTRGIATKGSFTSHVALVATSIYNTKYPKSNWPPNYTPIFEIIHPLTKVVVSYPFVDLVLIGLVNNETGEQLTWKEMTGYAADNNMRVVSEVFGKKTSDILNESKDNAEGYVLKWHLGKCPPLMARYTFDKYKRASNLIRTCDAKSIWMLLRNGQGLRGFLESKCIPGEYKEWARQVELDIQDKRKKLEMDAWKLIDSCPFLLRDKRMVTLDNSRFDRKYLAKWMLTRCPGRQQLAMLAFRMIDGKDYQEKLWDMAVPEPHRWVEEI